MNRHFDTLVELLAGLPGIGPRHAARIALFLLNRKPGDITELSDAIAQLPRTVRLCKECFNISDRERCPICIDSTRERSVFVVEKVSDLQAVERSGIWHGRYHVLGGNIDPVGKQFGANIRIPELKRRLAAETKQSPLEVVLATGTDAGGEATAQFIRQELEGIDGLTVTRLGRGLSSGAQLEYADEMTLRHALESRREG